METPGQRDSEIDQRRDHPRAVVVEDEFVVLLSLKDLLESLGCEVVATAQDADAGLRLVRSLRPDLVLMDLGLGKSDAVAATRAITTETQAHVIVVTAYDEAQTEAARQAGASHVLIKPVQEARLAEVIAELTGRPA